MQNIPCLQLRVLKVEHTKEITVCIVGILFHVHFRRTDLHTSEMWAYFVYRAKNINFLLLCCIASALQFLFSPSFQFMLGLLTQVIIVEKVCGFLWNWRSVWWAVNRKQASFTERYNLAQELQALCFACVMNSKSSRRNVDSIEKEEEKKRH